MTFTLKICSIQSVRKVLYLEEGAGTGNEEKQSISRQRPSQSFVCHSDRGVQYACMDYQRLLNKIGFVQSMSRKGSCWDNTPMKSFFGTLKTELIYHEDYQTRDQTRASIFEYVEAVYCTAYP